MTATTPITYEKGKLYNLNLADLLPDPDQPRKYFDEQALAELRASIEKHGVLQPVLVRQGADGGLLLVSGERRYLASKLAGCQTIPAVFTDGEPTEISIVENLLRENLTAIEEAEAIERLRAEHDYTLAELGAALGKAESTMSEILSLNRLPAEVKDDCRNDPKTSRSILVAIAAQVLALGAVLFNVVAGQFVKVCTAHIHQGFGEVVGQHFCKACTVGVVVNL